MLRNPTITRPQAIEDLLDAQLIARLGQLDISSRKVFAGKLKGERRSKKRGESVEFADHRAYVMGDDLRHIDWNLFGRLDRLFLKLFLEEEDLSLHIVIDASASSDTGSPHKFIFMQQLAAALGYIGLVNLNRVAVSVIGGKPAERSIAEVEGGSVEPATPREPTAVSSIRDLRGRRRLNDLVRFLCSVEPGGIAPFTEGAKRIAVTRRGKGVMVILSDFFIKEGYETALRMLRGHGYDLFALQVLSPDEIEPKIGGDLRLKDIEDADTAEVTISAPLLKRYKQNLEAYNAQLHDFCAQRDVIHALVPTNTPIDTLVMEYLRKRGLLV
jgi:uncharacterized protein (DUF58 family)